jgi:hypothetical protein
MRDEQINAAIAQECGWENVCQHPKNPNVWVGQHAGNLLEVPNFCGDLNDMYGAEQYLWRKDYYMRHDYVDELGKLLNPCNWQRMEASDMLDATARQRAEAFLKTLGKWDEKQ